MRTFGKWFLCVGALAIAAGTARAQGPGMGFGGGPFILMSENVQKALKLSDQQTGKVEQTAREIFMNHQDELQALRDLSDEERPKKIRELMTKMNDEVKKALAFTDDQSKRFDQISMQSRGIGAFADPEVQGKLKLSDDQKSKLTTMATESREKFREIFQDAAGDFEAARKKIQELQKDLMSKALAVLSDDQKKSWKELTGDAVDIQFPRRAN
jgi:hypothetical protein